MADEHRAAEQALHELRRAIDAYFRNEAGPELVDARIAAYRRAQTRVRRSVLARFNGRPTTPDLVLHS
jgi:hypothetical protein